MARNRPRSLSFVGDSDDLASSSRPRQTSRPAAERGADPDRRARTAESVRRAIAASALAAAGNAGHARDQRPQLSGDRRGHRSADRHRHVAAVAGARGDRRNPWKPCDERRRPHATRPELCASTPRSTANSTPRTRSSFERELESDPQLRASLRQSSRARDARAASGAPRSGASRRLARPRAALADRQRPTLPSRMAHPACRSPLAASLAVLAFIGGVGAGPCASRLRAAIPSCRRWSPVSRAGRFRGSPSTSPRRIATRSSPGSRAVSRSAPPSSTSPTRAIRWRAGASTSSTARRCRRWSIAGANISSALSELPLAAAPAQSAAEAGSLDGFHIERWADRGARLCRGLGPRRGRISRLRRSFRRAQRPAPAVTPGKRMMRIAPPRPSLRGSAALY